MDESWFFLCGFSGFCFVFVGFHFVLLVLDTSCDTTSSQWQFVLSPMMVPFGSSFYVTVIL